MFDTPFFASPDVLLLGAATGLVFGFLLQKGGITRFEVIVGQFLLRDFTVLKVMLTAMVVGGTGIYGMIQLDLLDGPSVKAAHLVANALGGLIFGVGMALLGYCPGTGIAALGDGSRHAIWGVAGMLAGAAAFAEVYPWVSAHVLPLGDRGKATLATEIGISPWWLLALLAVISVAIFLAIEASERRARREAS